MVPLYRIVGSMVPLDPKFRLCLNRHVFTDVYFTDEYSVRRTYTTIVFTTDTRASFSLLVSHIDNIIHCSRILSRIYELWKNAGAQESHGVCSPASG